MRSGVTKIVWILMVVTGVALTAELGWSQAGQSKDQVQSQTSTSSIMETVRKEIEEQAQKSKCENKYIILVLEGIEFRTPRYSTIYKSVNAPNVIQRVWKKGCDLEKIEDVYNFSITPLSEGFGVSIILDQHKDDGEPKSTYQFWKSYLDEGVEKGVVTKFPDGTVKVLHKRIERYLLPATKAPNFYNEPVLIDCLGSTIASGAETSLTANCRTKYRNTDGLNFGYTFLRREVQEKDYLAYDAKQRALYDAMKIDGDQNNGK